MRSSRTSRSSRRPSRSSAGISEDVAEADLSQHSIPGSPVEAPLQESAVENAMIPGLDVVTSRLTTQVSTLLSSFCDRLMDRLATLQVNAQQDVRGVSSTFPGVQQFPAAHTVKPCSTPSPTSSRYGLPPSEKVQSKSNHAVQSQSGDEEERVRSVAQTGSLITPDGWISELALPEEETLLPVPPSWLREMAPAVNIEPFDGDPLKWDMFISSFKSLVHDVVGSNAQRLAILRQLLVPSLRSALASSLSSPETYAHALNDLRRLYGNPNAVIAACLRKLSKIEPMKPRSDVDAERFYLELHGILNILRARERVVEVKSAYTLQTVVTKLTGHLRRKWAQKLFDIRPREATLEDLDLWLEQTVLTNRMVEPVDSLNAARGPQEMALRSHRHRLNVATVLDSPAECVLCHNGHLLSVCPEYIKLTPNRRAEIAKDFRRCFACLDGVHNARRCPKRSRCDIACCNQRHHRLLHGSRRVWPSASTADSQVVAESNDTQAANIGANTVDHVSVCLSVVPVCVAVGSLSIPTFALLDPGSQGTLITNELACRLSLTRKPSNVHLSTFHGQDPALRISSVDFVIRGGNEQQQFDIKGALVVPSLNLSHRIVNWDREKDKWQHLSDLPLSIVDYGKVSVLIGADNFEVIQPLALRKPPRKGEPFGMLTPLGWTVVGRLSQPFGLPKESIEQTINEIVVRGDSHLQSEMEIYERFWSTESFGTKPVNDYHNINLSAVKWPSSFDFVDGRYQVGLLWKTERVELPNNRPMAMGRFASLRRKLSYDRRLYEQYREAMSVLRRSGVVRSVTNGEVNMPAGKVWYLPHHPVVHPFKPDKVRIVFDASAKYNGLSLNDHLSKGPDLMSDMTALLIRFRRLPIAVTSDVANMFHQVGVPKQDRSVLRFLWSDALADAPKTYEFTRQVFGLTSAPSSCIYALLRCIHEFSPAEWTLRFTRQFYVDNYLDSFSTLEEAIALCTALRTVALKGGFPLVKWASNRAEVLRSFPEEVRSTSGVNINLCSRRVENVLGLYWDRETDTLRFPVSIPASPVRTKRELFSAVARLFDPIGLLAPVVLRAKWMMREATDEASGWDTPISERVRSDYQRWLTELQLVKELAVPRWMGLELDGREVQLHVFADASELAFGAVAYIRFLDKDRLPATSLVMAKSRIAPRRSLTIPRLELQAAVLALRLGRTTARILEFDPEKTTYWTDSLTVLKWLRMRGPRLDAFVAHRIAELVTDSSPDQWRHVPGKENPADDISRGVSASQLACPTSRWLVGPGFLRLREESWPKPTVPADIQQENSEAVIPASRVHIVNVCSNNLVLRLFDVISHFPKVIRIVAYMCRFARSRKCSYPSKELSGWEIRRALFLCIRVLQREVFAEELQALSTKRILDSRSALSRLDPFIDEEGLLRVGGRLRFADVPVDLKHPIILPPSNAFVYRLIWQKHLELMHGKTERVLAELRGQFWLLGGRRSVRKVVDRCHYCRRMNVAPDYPIMAPLPKERLTCLAPAFVNVGVDCFGPFQVIVKRSLLKRYGCIFTCLTSRASHLEVLHSLDVHSFMLALRRFIARRGLPATIFSDNGRNFVATERTLRDIMASDRVRQQLADRQIDWKFMPPGGPHFGGVWERLIAVAKRALMAVLEGNTVTDELLATVFAEVESLLNGRPLAYIGTDPSQPEPLTPFLLLTGRVNVHVPPDILCKPKCTILKHWSRAVEIADRFWRRWQREFLPTLQGRSKWTTPNRNLQVDDVVVVVEPASPRGHWPIGRVVQVFPGRDSRVRVAIVKTKEGVYKRPVARLAILERAHEYSA